MLRRTEAKEMGIDKFVLTYCGNFNQEILKLHREMAFNPSMKVFRYEDVAYKKRLGPSRSAPIAAGTFPVSELEPQWQKWMVSPTRSVQISMNERST